QGSKLVAGLQNLLGVRRQLAVDLLQGGSVADRGHHVMKRTAVAVVVADVVGDDRVGPAAGSELALHLQQPGGLGAEVVAQLEEDRIRPECLLECSQSGLILSGGQVEEVTSVPGGGGKRGSCLSFRLVAVGQAAEPA